MPGVKKRIYKMRVLVAAGGTGGHLYPAIALAQKLKREFPNLLILWIGGRKKFERQIVERENIQFKSINILSFPRSLSPKWLNFIFRMAESFIQCSKHIFTFKPGIAVGMGSFHSYPVVMLAFFFGIPTIICEQNVYPSLTNRMLLPFTSRIVLSFPHSMKYLSTWSKKKAIIIGNPVREKIVTTSKKEGIRKLNLKEGKFTLLFLGGSQGAHHLNKTAIKTLCLIQKEKWGENIQFILITGEKDYSRIIEKSKINKTKGIIFSYLSDIHYALAASDLVISRSGATTISEITACGLPCILVPYPFATDQHQLENAFALEKQGAAKVIIQEKLNPLLLKTTIKHILQNQQLRNKMGKASQDLGKLEAAQNLTDLIIKLGKK